MRKLSQLKEWLTLEDTAKELSEILSEQVNVADVLRLGLDGHLKLSLYFVNQTMGKVGKVVTYKDVKRKSLGYPFNAMSLEKAKSKLKEDIPLLKFNPGLDGYCIEGIRISSELVFEPDGECLVTGVWDLLMKGEEARYVDDVYEIMTSKIIPARVPGGGAFLSRRNNEMCYLDSLPKDAVLIVRTSSIKEFKSSVAEKTIGISEQTITTQKSNVTPLFIDLDLLTKLLKRDKPEDFWFYKDCVVNGDGIHARAFDKHIRASLIGDEWHTLEEFAKDIKLNLPCTYGEFAVWARRNRFSNILDGIISSETHKIQGMDEFNEKYEAIHGYSFWGDKAQSDEELIEVNIDNQTLVDNSLQQLIEKNNLTNATEWNYFFVLFSWKHQLEKEKESLVPKDYSNRKDYEDRIHAINGKISEIDSFNTKAELEDIVQRSVSLNTDAIERKSIMDKKEIVTEISYQAWGVYENLDIFTAAALWCDKNPYNYESWSNIEYIEVRNLIINILKHQLDAENYPIEKRNAVLMELAKIFDQGLSECMKASFKFVLSREQLKAIAINTGVRPQFLFGDSKFEKEKLEKKYAEQAAELPEQIDSDFESEESKDAELCSKADSNIIKSIKQGKRNNKTPIAIIRLNILKEFIVLLEKAAKAKSIDINKFALPVSKENLLDELKKRHSLFKRIKIDTFKDDWQIDLRKAICNNVDSSSQIDKGFFKKILG